MRDFMGSSKILSVTLNHFLYNAAILGFYNIIRDEPGVKIQNNSLSFPANIFDDFEDKYISKMINTFGHTTIYSEILQRYRSIKNTPITEETEKKIEEFFDYSTDKLTRASYMSGYDIINKSENGTKVDVPKILKEIRKAKDNRAKIEMFAAIEEYLEENKETLCMKDIMYTNITSFWQGISFLHRQNQKEDIKACYKEYFVDPAIKYVNKTSKGKFNCIECSAPITQSESFGMAWLNDVGIDLKRKKSYYWNFKPDSFLCPVCNLIYSCIPLGFVTIGKEGLFINDNSDFDTLVSCNSTEGLQVSSIYEAENKIYGRLLARLTQQADTILAKREIQNIQVIRRKYYGDDKIRYELNTLSFERLNVLKDRQKDFNFLTGFSLNIDQEYVNIYDQVISNFFAGRNQFSLLYKILTLAFTDPSVNKIPYAASILRIQAATRKGGNKLGVSLMNLRKMQKDGYKLRMMLSSQTLETLEKEQSMRTHENDIDNKLRGYAYHLLNALKTRNKENFMDIILRMYTGLGQPVPDLFIEMLKDEQAFLELGYAYLIGLKGENPNN